MKAIIIREHGGPSVLRYESVPTPEVSSSEVLIKIHAIGVNHLDIDVREGLSGYKFPMPHVMGNEGAGEVVAVGANVTAYAPGDRVISASALSSGICKHVRCNCIRGMDNICLDFGKLGITCWGTYAEYLRVSATNLVRIPAAISYRQAAAGRTAFSTAWELAVSHGQVREGETVLVNGAGGGVGTAAVAVAKLAGARVIGTVGSEAKAEKLRAMGIDDVINYQTSDMAKEAMRLTDGRGVDLAIETVGGDILRATVNSMALGGRIAIAGAHAGEHVTLDIIQLFRRQIRIVTSHSFPKSATHSVFALMAQGKLAPVIADQLPLQETAQAQQLLANRRVFGKVVMYVEGTGT